MMSPGKNLQTNTTSQPPPSRHGRGGARKDPNKPKAYVGIGRIGFNSQDTNDTAPAYRQRGEGNFTIDHSRFNVDEGRDYTLDAPSLHPLVKQKTSKSIKSNDSDKKLAVAENFNIPEIKSPA